MEQPAIPPAQPLCPRMPHTLFGGDYNPEQWPEATWREDARAMREAGVNLVSVGIFSWARLEPRPGEYDFGWLDRVLDILHEHGVAVDLATATASPPPWLARLHPESLPVTMDGVTLSPGGRQQYCPSSAGYREAAASLARAGDSLQGPSGAGDVACEQRVWLPRRGMLLRRVGGRIPPLAGAPLPDD